MAQPEIGHLAARLIQSAFDQSAIDTRYTVISEIENWLPTQTGGAAPFRSPSTGERNAIYRQAAPGMFAAAARDALMLSNFESHEITHVITVSCTGFFAPGPDFLLVKALGLRNTVERVHIGFMGCAAAFPALRIATHISNSDPNAVVLVVCAELCSLHIRSSSDPEDIVASAIFGDGAAAAVVSAKEPRTLGAILEINDFGTTVTSDGEDDLDWTIGDKGFEMRLTAQVPRIIEREISGVMRAALGSNATAASNIDGWAVHPGGRSVLDRVETGLELSDGALDHSRHVLRTHGNMSSATVLFILQRILDDTSLGENASVVGLGFGPGLTVEMARFTRRAARPSDHSPLTVSRQ